jgi:AcrR family transcriptional regulator
MASPLVSLGRRRSTAERRRDRERDIIAATRRLFDDRGAIDAQVEDIARAVGINKALIYRHFAGKEELFALTLADYLGELDERMVAADGNTRRAPLTRLRNISETFVDFCLEYPAFADCAMNLLRRTGDELFGEITEPVMARLGTAMSTLLGRTATVLRAGQATGVFDTADADFTANFLYTQTLGAMHMARMGLIVSASSPGRPEVHHASPELVRQTAITATLATAVGRKAVRRPQQPSARTNTKAAPVGAPDRGTVRRTGNSRAGEST